MRPSRNPDGYVAETRPGLTADMDLPQPPYWILMPLALAGAGVIILLTAVFGGLRPSTRIWTMLAGLWVARSQITRWWEDTDGDRTVSWRPAGAFAITAIALGLATALLFDGRHDRGFVIYVALAIALFGGDALDWLLRRRHRARTSGTS